MSIAWLCTPLFDVPCVEPQRRMVAGRFGWAIHRHPIKGGITPMQAHRITLQESIARKNSFLQRLLNAAQGATA